MELVLARIAMAAESGYVVGVAVKGNVIHAKAVASVHNVAVMPIAKFATTAMAYAWTARGKAMYGYPNTLVAVLVVAMTPTMAVVATLDGDASSVAVLVSARILVQSITTSCTVTEVANVFSAMEADR